MEAMPRPRPPYLHRTETRHGKVAWYFWRRPGPKIRIRGEYGSPEFLAAYEAARAQGASPAPVRRKEATNSLAWLIERHRDSGAWAGLSAATKRQRENIYRRVVEKAGAVPFAEITRSQIVETRDKTSDRPSAANNFLQAMRKLFKWAVEAGHMDADPTEGVTTVSRPKTGGFRQWTEDEIQQFEARWPIGTRERLALAVLLYTGLRRGDAVRLGKQHIRNGMIEIVTEKTATPVVIPVLPVLQDVIDRSPTGDLVLIARLDGRPRTKESFGTWFKEACKAAGVPDGSAHGLRKAGATRAAEAGATVHELNAIFGWSGSQMASLYTEKANRARLAKGAMGKLAANKK